jgi:acetyltransferase-like isoleucine patch superfamily enzyme
VNVMPDSFLQILLARSPSLGYRFWRLFGGRVLPHIRGRGNRLQADGATLLRVELDIVGDDNQIIVGQGSYLTNLKIRMRGSGHRLVFGRNCRVSRGGVFWFEDENGLLEIGENTTMVEAHIVVDEPGSKVIIGKDCMFANDIEIRVSDSHAILDAATGQRLNPARDILIGDHVWIAAHAIVLKGVEIGRDSVVAAGAVVTKSCPPGVILAGNPASVIKEGITWRRERNPKE